MGASFHQSYTVLKGNSGIFKNIGTSLSNFVPNSQLRKFCFRLSIIKMLSTLLDKGGRSEHDKLDRCQSTKLTDSYDA